MSSGQPVMMKLARAHISGSFTKACWKASLWSGMMQGMMDSNIQWKVWAWPGTESREFVWYDHFFPWAVMDCEIISL